MHLVLIYGCICYTFTSYILPVKISSISIQMDLIFNHFVTHPPDVRADRSFTPPSPIYNLPLKNNEHPLTFYLFDFFGKSTCILILVMKSGNYF